MSVEPCPGGCADGVIFGTPDDPTAITACPVCNAEPEPAGVPDDWPPPSPPPLRDMAAAIQLAGEPIPYLIEPIAVRGHHTVLVGRHSSFKTWAMLLGGHAVHRGGGEVAGMTCSAGTVLYIDAENGPRVLGKRFRDAGVPADGLFVAEGAHVALPRDIAKIGQWASAVEADMVVLDSLRRLAPGAREDRSDDMSPLVGAISDLSHDTDLAVVTIHHRSSKAGSALVRGSSAIEDQADLVFLLERAEGDPQRNRRRLHPVKFRLDEPPEDAWLTLADEADPDADSGRRLVLIEADPPGEGGTASGTASEVRQQEREDAVRGMLSQAGGTRDGTAGQPITVRNIADATGIPKTTVGRILARFAEQGEARWTEETGWCPTVPFPLRGGVGRDSYDAAQPTLTSPTGPAPRSAVYGPEDGDR
jgi:hypothetical protein